MNSWYGTHEHGRIPHTYNSCGGGGVRREDATGADVLLREAGGLEGRSFIHYIPVFTPSDPFE